MSSHTAPDASLPPVTTLLAASERTLVDAAGAGYYRTMHRDRVEDVIHDLRSQRIQAILVSVSYAAQKATSVGMLVREFPRIRTVALLTEADARTPQAVLALGRSGFDRLIDIRTGTGWQQLRGALLADVGAAGERAIMTQLATDLDGVPEDCWAFFETIFTGSPQLSTIRKLARHFDIRASTMMSRFLRAGAPAAKAYLANARLVRAARLFENSGFSSADVANHLDFSSPQSLGRHLRITLGTTTATFRAAYSGQRMFDEFRRALVLPYREPLRALHPFASLPGHCMRSYPRTVHARRRA